MKMKALILNLFLVTILLTNTAHAQFGSLKKWFNKEVVPTIKGDRPLKIDPTRVRINHEGKDILKVSTEGEGSLYVDFGVATLKTNELKKEIARTTAIFSGNTAVMSQVAFEQFQQVYQRELKEAQEANLITVSRTPPPAPVQPNPAPTSRKVIIYNHSSATLNYILNGHAFELKPDEGYEHTSSSGEFFLQFDDDPSEKDNVARYYLTGSEYSLYLYENMSNIGIFKFN
jgi:hypothetical protein